MSRRWREELVRTYLERDLPSLGFRLPVPALRQLQSWHENLGKRQVKAPKIYLRDSGLLHTLLGLPDARALETHPKVGASWEGFALEAVIGRLGARPEECFFWATYSGAEIDLLVVRGRHRIGVEFKRTTAPTVTRSMHVAADDLRLDRLYVVHAGRHSFEMASGIEAIAFERLLEDVKPLR